LIATRARSRWLLGNFRGDIFHELDQPRVPNDRESYRGVMAMNVEKKAKLLNGVTFEIFKGKLEASVAKDSLN